MYKAIINGQPREVEIKEEEILINGVPQQLDLSILNSNTFHIIKNSKSYTAEIIAVDKKEKTVEVKVNNKVISVTVKDKMDQLLEKLGMEKMAEDKVQDIHAPMPGSILDIMVKEGGEVEKGDPIMILEAMKMENVLKAPGAGIIKGIKVKKGENVDKNQVLIQF